MLVIAIEVSHIIKTRVDGLSEGGKESGVCANRDWEWIVLATTEWKQRS